MRYYYLCTYLVKLVVANALSRDPVDAPLAEEKEKAELADHFLRMGTVNALLATQKHLAEIKTS